MNSIGDSAIIRECHQTREEETYLRSLEAEREGDQFSRVEILKPLTLVQDLSVSRRGSSRIPERIVYILHKGVSPRLGDLEERAVKVHNDVLDGQSGSPKIEKIAGTLTFPFYRPRNLV